MIDLNGPKDRAARVLAGDFDGDAIGATQIKYALARDVERLVAELESIRGSDPAQARDIEIEMIATALKRAFDASVEHFPARADFEHWDCAARAAYRLGARMLDRGNATSAIDSHDSITPPPPPSKPAGS